MNTTSIPRPIVHEHTFNLSQVVKVKLTERGREAFIKKAVDNHTYTPSQATQYLDTQMGDDGYHQFHLIELMAVFGDLMLPAPITQDRRHVLFENMELILVPDPEEVSGVQQS